MRNFCRCRDVFGLAGDLFVIGDDHPATAGGDDLVAVEADGTQKTEVAGVFALEVTTQGLCSILHKRDIKLGAHLGDLVDTARVAEGVHRHASSKAAAGDLVVRDAILHLGVGEQELAQRIRAHAQGALVHIHENRMRANIGDCVASSDKSEGLGDDFITTLDPGHNHGDVQGCGAIDRCHAVLRPAIGRDPPLEFSYAGADGRNEIGVDAFCQVRLFVSTKNRPVKCYSLAWKLLRRK